jgi:integrase
MRSAIGSIQRLGKDYYRVSVEGKSKQDGGRTRKVKRVRGTRSEAEAVLAKMKLDEGKLDGCELTLGEYWKVFYEPTLSSLAESTASSYRYAWNGLVEPLFGDRKMSELKARDVEHGLLSIEKPGAQRNAYKLLRQMYNEAYRDELVEDNPMTRRIRLKRMNAYQPDVLLLDDVPAWLDAVRGSKWEPVLLVMLFGGLRREEACALFWEDFEFGVGMCSIRVDKTLTEVRGKLVDGPTKTAESTRTVFLGGSIAGRMLELSGVGPLCPDSNGNRTRPDRVSREYRKLMQGKDAKYVPMKNLRNSYATIMQGIGASDSLISKSLGHTNLQVDYNHYFAANAPAHLANARALDDAVSERVVLRDAVKPSEM